MILLPIVVGLLIMAGLILASRSLAQANTVVVRQALLRVGVLILLSAGVFVWARYWVVHMITCSPDCVGANLAAWDLKGAILRNSDFAEANLQHANLSFADLYNADFAGANLSGVNFRNANLRGVRFVGTTLASADLRGAFLGDTDLRGADLNGADLTQIDLTGVHLEGATFDKAKLVAANLRGKNLVGASFVQADLTGADLSNANLSGSRLSGANLSGARLVNSNLSGALLNLADLTGADLRGANLAGAQLLGATLASANLSNSQLSGATLIGAHINGADLSSADLTGVRPLANDLLPNDILTDPLLQELNELQLANLISDVDSSGARFNRQTKWPAIETSTLVEMLGTKYYEFAPPTPAAEQVDEQATILVIGDSASTIPLSQAIYTQFAEDGNTQPIVFYRTAPGPTFDSFCTSDNIHLVAANRPFDDDAGTRCLQNGRKLITFTVALEAVVVVVNARNNFIDDLSVDELSAVATAEHWSDVNLSWPRMEIKRYIPGDETVPVHFWIEKVFNGNIEAAQSTVEELSQTSNIAQLVQWVSNEPYAVGVFDYSTYLQNADLLKLVTINGQTPTIESVNSNAYVLTQALYLYADANQINRLPELQLFLAYYFDHVNQVAEQIGVFPVAPELLEQAKTELNFSFN